MGDRMNPGSFFLAFGLTKSKTFEVRPFEDYFASMRARERHIKVTRRIGSSVLYAVCGPYFSTRPVTYDSLEFAIMTLHRRPDIYIELHDIDPDSDEGRLVITKAAAWRLSK